MKGFFRWFKNSAKIKRWILLILIGICLACFGFSNLLILETASFLKIGKIVAIFVVGFTATIVGLVYMQKRILEILVEDNNNSNADKADVKTLIFNKNVYDNGPKIVVIGGGSGLEIVLTGIKRYTSNVTAIVTVSDYGVKPSISRKELKLAPLDDVKGSLVALSPREEHMSKLFGHKFENGKLKNLSFGDIYMCAMDEIYGSMTESIKESKNVLNIVGKVLPVTLDEITVCAELKDGTVVKEKDKIPEMVYNKVSSINRIYINPSNAVPAPGVIETISEADCIIIGPGSLYTNIIPNLIIKNVSKAIKESKAMKVYISNIMTEPGETDNYTVSEHINAIIEHTGKGIIDFCVCDTGEITPEFVRKYNKYGSDVVEQDVEKLISNNIKIIRRDLSCIKNETIRHNPDSIAGIIAELICSDLKFKDKQNDKQYILLNTQLKEERERQKKLLKVKKKEKHAKEEEKKTNTIKRQSKFNEKYKERIESIQNSEKLREERLKEIQERNKKIKK